MALRNRKPNLDRPHGKLATRTAAAAENVPPNSGAVGNVPSAANASHEQSSQLGSKVGNMRRMVHKYAMHAQPLPSCVVLLIARINAWPACANAKRASDTKQS